MTVANKARQITVQGSVTCSLASDLCQSIINMIRSSHIRVTSGQTSDQNFITGYFNCTANCTFKCQGPWMKVCWSCCMIHTVWRYQRNTASLQKYAKNDTTVNCRLSDPKTVITKNLIEFAYNPRFNSKHWKVLMLGSNLGIDLSNIYLFDVDSPAAFKKDLINSGILK